MSANGTVDVAPDSLTILEAAEHIAEHLRGRREDADLGRALDVLRTALASARLRASGEVDAQPRREIDPADWRGLIFDWESGFVADWDVAVPADFTGPDPLPLEPVVRTIRAYPTSGVMDRSAPAGCFLPGDGPEGTAGYHRVVADVTVRAANVNRLWPPASRRTMATIAGETRCREWLVSLMSPTADPIAKGKLLPEARKKFGVSEHAFERAWNEAIKAKGAEQWRLAGRRRKSAHL